MLLKWLCFAQALALLVCEGKYASILADNMPREPTDLETADTYISSSRSRLLAGRDGNTVLGIILNETDPGDFLAIGEFQESIYFISNFTLPKVEADSYCQQFGGHLTSVVTQEEYDFITTLRRESGIQVFWIGVEALTLTILRSDFLFTDGTSNTAFIHPSESQSTFPWGAEPIQPNGDGECVLWETLDTLFDHGCIFPYNFMCKIPFGSDIVPTAAPVETPTISPSFFFSRKLGNDTFFIPQLLATQSDARAFCKENDGDLARIIDRTEYEFVKEMITDARLGGSSGSIWLGIESNFPSSDPGNFYFTDGLTTDFRFIHVRQGSFPWAFFSPSLFAQCVSWSPRDLFTDLPCSFSLKFLCRISGPLLPTKQPTGAPTILLRFSIGSNADSDFFLIEEYLTQSAASERCSQEDPTAALAEIRDIDEYTALRDQIGYEYGHDLWLIYVLEQKLLRFRFSVAYPTSTSTSFLGSKVGNFPWASAQPDFEGTCVVWRLDSGFYDRDCSQTNYILCRSGIASQLTSDGQGLVFGLIFGLGGVVVIIIGISLCFRHYRSQSASNIGIETNRPSDALIERAEQTGSMSTRLGVPLPESQDEVIGAAEIPMAAYESDRQTADTNPPVSRSI